jgi:hypothetical protein
VANSLTVIKLAALVFGALGALYGANDLLGHPGALRRRLLVALLSASLYTAYLAALLGLSLRFSVQPLYFFDSLYPGFSSNPLLPVAGAALVGFAQAIIFTPILIRPNRSRLLVFLISLLSAITIALFTPTVASPLLTFIALILGGIISLAYNSFLITSHNLASDVPSRWLDILGGLFFFAAGMLQIVLYYMPS